MLTIKDITNPTVKNKESNLRLPENMYLRDIFPDDLRRVIHEYVNVINEEGVIVGAVKTERLRYLVFKQYETTFMQILDTMSVGIVAIDRDSRIFYVNQSYARILGLEISKVLGRYMSVIEPEATLLKVLETETEMSVENQLIKSVNRYVNTNMHLLTDDGKVTGAYSVFVDVTNVNELHDELERISGVVQEYTQQERAKKILEENKIIGQSKKYLDCVEKALKVAVADTTVLIRGENGVGKELITNIIKDNSQRSEKPFISVNCSAIPESLFESELFGYESGAFTGAAKGGKLGKFQLADKGILFLDEIGDMPYSMQSKLLRTLQQGEIEKVGRQGEVSVNVRVIAATNKCLEKMVEEGTFREDLYYRLNVVSIKVPALRERGNDVLLLTDYFLKEYCKKYSRKVGISGQAYKVLTNYTWPGNVRELRNVIESAVILCNGDLITSNDLPENIRAKVDMNCLQQEVTDMCDAPSETISLKEEVLKFEKEFIMRTIEQCNGDKNKAMEILKLPKRTFYRKIAIFGTKDK